MYDYLAQYLPQKVEAIETEKLREIYLRLSKRTRSINFPRVAKMFNIPIYQEIRTKKKIISSEDVVKLSAALINLPRYKKCGIACPLETGYFLFNVVMKDKEFTNSIHTMFRCETLEETEKTLEPFRDKVLREINKDANDYLLKRLEIVEKNKVA